MKKGAVEQGAQESMEQGAVEQESQESMEQESLKQESVNLSATLTQGAEAAEPKTVETKTAKKNRKQSSKKDSREIRSQEQPKEQPKEQAKEQPKQKRSVFGSLRDKAATLRSSSRKSASEEKAKSKVKSKATIKATTKPKLKIVANDKPQPQPRGDVVGKSVESAVIETDKVAQGDYLVHPAHGVGYVRGVEAEDIAGARLDMIAISFEQERMIVRVPTGEYQNCGLRSVSSPEAMEGIYDTLKTKRRIRKTMWGRRAQEYDNKIRSGDPVRLAQVVRELYRGEEQPSPSYSERQYYQLALERLSREVAVVEKIEERLAVEKLETILAAA